MLSLAGSHGRGSWWPVRAALLTCVLTAIFTPGVRAAVPSDPHEAKAREILERVIAFKTEEGMGQVPRTVVRGFQAFEIIVRPHASTNSTNLITSSGLAR